MPVEHQNMPPGPLRRASIFLVKAVVSVALLAVLLSRLDTDELWAGAKSASMPLLLLALGLYGLHVLTNTWRWRLLLDAQGVIVPLKALAASYLVAGFFNNFLPSNIGGDVVRVRDTARAAGSRTLATTVILVDRGLGLIGLVLLAALGATAAAMAAARAPAAALLGTAGAVPVRPAWLWAGFIAAAGAAAPALLAPDGLGRVVQPLTIVHPEWIGARLETLTSTLSRFRERPRAMATCFAGALGVQVLLVLYHLAVAMALHLDVSVWHLAVIVPISYVVQMVPVSVNGFGVREATFSLYFARLGLPIEGAVLLSLVATAVMMVFSLTGAIAYVARGGAHGGVSPELSQDPTQQTR